MFGDKCHYRTLSVGISLALGGLLFLLVVVMPVTSHNDQHRANEITLAKLDERLRDLIINSSQAENIDVIVYLVETVELDQALLQSAGVARRELVVNLLQQSADSSQKALLNFLELSAEIGTIQRYEPLWIVNAVLVSASPSSINEIAARPDVNNITLDVRQRYITPTLRTNLVTTPTLPWGVERVYARHAWEALGIDGSGITVAIMDTGVDWSHSALLANYRGYEDNGSVTHNGNWYDAIEDSKEPFDPNGHGTHVAGTAVGRGGIGVAPGARWIAVRTFDEFGFASFGEIHRSFQWLLAPEGNPALGPDLVNNSWSGSPELLEFQADVKALKSAGIIPVFAAGNDGPFEGTIGAPASYHGTIAVGASDSLDQVAWFSGRGPSPLTSQIKPTLLAPGAAIWSSLPDNQYGYASGTSMAAPHVTGAIALILSTNPALSETFVTAVLTATTKAIEPSSPNLNAGWGRLDAYAALIDQIPTGELYGRLLVGGEPVPNGTVDLTAADGITLPYKSDKQGNFRAHLRPGIYELSVDAFGFQPYHSPPIPVSTQAVEHDIVLERPPHGKIAGFLFEAGSLTPITGTLGVVFTPLQLVSGPSGKYELTLPVGTYTLTVEATGYRIENTRIEVVQGQTHYRNFYLRKGPRTLLVDSGAWYYDSQLAYFSSALQDNALSFDIWSIHDPFYGSPTAETLNEYDIVMWSSPQDAPADVGAGEVLASYLDEGGRLFISGQNVAERSGSPFYPQYWWHGQLRGNYLGPSQPPFTPIGQTDTLFEGLSLSLNGEDSAANQETPDRVEPARNSYAGVSLQYDNGDGAALHAGQCAPFRIVYLGFGLEGVSGRQDRADIVARSYRFFAEPEREAGMLVEPRQVEQLVVPGTQIHFNLQVTNLSETLTDTFNFETSVSTWPASLITSTLQLGPCEIGVTTLSITVPPDAVRDSIEHLAVVITSSLDAANSIQIPVTLKTPGHILLVDDDRWYDQEQTYRRSLDESGYRYDFWDTDSPTTNRAGPPADLLREYIIVLWYTGYDWFRPITRAERESLEVYLEHGGRLFLTSQDFLYYHQQTQLARDYFGVLRYKESITPTVVFATDDTRLFAGIPAPIPLTYGLYQNFSDGILPASSAQIALWHDQGLAAAVVNTGRDWRTQFWAIPFETLPTGIHASLMDRIIGWLSDLGDSDFAVDRRNGSSLPGPSAIRTYTLTLRNMDLGITNTVAITNTLPQYLDILAPSVTGGAIYDLNTRRLTWQGELSSGDEHTISYQAVPIPGLPKATRIDNAVSIHYLRHDLTFERLATIWLDAPDLSTSYVSANPSINIAGRPVTISLFLSNTGQESGIISTTTRLPDEFVIVSDTFTSTEVGLTYDGQYINWQGLIPAGQNTLIEFQINVPFLTGQYHLPATTVISDGSTAPFIRHTILYITPLQQFLPIISRRS